MSSVLTFLWKLVVEPGISNPMPRDIGSYLSLRFGMYVTLRHGPFDILGGGGGAWVFFEKKFLALILAKKIILLNGTVKKIICLQ